MSTVRVQKKERQLVEFLKRALKKSSACGASWRMVGTERGGFKGKMGKGDRKEEGWGLRQETQVEGRYQKALRGAGFEAHVVKKTQVCWTDLCCNMFMYWRMQGKGKWMFQ